MKTRQKFIKQQVARDTRTGRFVKLSTARRSPKRIRIETVRIPLRPAATL